MGGTHIAFLLSWISSNLCYVAPPQGSLTDCLGVHCRPGRECVVTTGLAQCVCRKACPDHWKPVCGSDGVSYDNHCELHRAACNQNTHISPLHQSFCKGDREAVLARQEFIQQLSLWDEDEPAATQIPLPDACFQNDRDRLREFIINWFQISAKKQPWYSPGMSSGEELWEHFNTMTSVKGSTSVSGALDSGSWLSYLSRNRTVGGRHRADKMRQLCLDALVEEGDTDYDWRLSFTEFRRLMTDSYQPTSKVCSLNGVKFEDGAETAVECNGCVCACGKWICTAEMCPEGYQDIIKEEDSEEEEDTDEENPEDDPHVADIRWF